MKTMTSRFQNSIKIRTHVTLQPDELDSLVLDQRDFFVTTTKEQTKE